MDIDIDSDDDAVASKLKELQQGVAATTSQPSSNSKSELVRIPEIEESSLTFLGPLLNHFRRASLR